MTDPNLEKLIADSIEEHGAETAATMAKIEKQEAETRKDKAPRVHAVIAHDGPSYDWETWREAVAKAAKIHADNEKYEREQKTARIERKAMEAAAAPPTLTARLESIIREIVREEINQVQTEDF